MEENKYKYLVNVSNLVRLVKYSINTGWCPDDSTRYIVTVKSKDSDVWETFHKMRMREDNDILFFISTQVDRVLILVDVDRFFDNIHHTFDLNFIGTEYSLDSEFARGLKRINSLDDIEKSHVDEPGEPGEQGVEPALNGKTPVEVNLCDIFESYEECWDIGDRMLIHAKSSQKAIDFLNSVQKNKASCEWFVSIPGHVCYYKLLVICPFDGYIRLLLEPLPWSEVGRVSFSAPTLTGVRGTKPLQPGMLTYTDTADAGSKDEFVCTKQKSLSEALLEIHPALKSTLEREMDLLQRCKVNSYLFERKEDPKFPQMRRARLNKPKSI